MTSTSCCGEPLARGRLLHIEHSLCVRPLRDSEVMRSVACPLSRVPDIVCEVAELERLRTRGLRRGDASACLRPLSQSDSNFFSLLGGWGKISVWQTSSSATLDGEERSWVASSEDRVPPSHESRDRFQRFLRPVEERDVTRRTEHATLVDSDSDAPLLRPSEPSALVLDALEEDFLRPAHRRRTRRLCDDGDAQSVTRTRGRFQVLSNEK